MLVIVSWAALRSPGIQTLLAKKVIENISAKIGVNVQASKIRFGLNNTLIIKDLFIPDKSADTLLYVKRLEARLKNIDLNSGKIELEKLSLKSLQSKIVQNEKNHFNFSFIIDSLKTDKPHKKNWAVSCNKLYLTHHSYSYKGLNQSYLLNNFYLQADSIFSDSANAKMNLVSCSAELNNKPFIRDLHLHFIKTANTFQIFNTIANLNKSKIDLPDINLIVDFNSRDKKFAYKTQINHSLIHLSDLWFLNKTFYNNSDQITLSGVLNGSDKKIAIQRLNLKTGTTTKFSGNANLFNLRNKAQLSYELNINEFITSKEDAFYFIDKYLPQDTASIPAYVELLGKISYTGDLKGTGKNIAMQGVLLSHVGKFISSMTVTSDSIDFYTIKASLESKPLFLNRISPESGLGKAYASIHTQGTYSKTSGPDFNISGKLKKMEYNKRSIDSVTIDGRLTHEKFTGKIASFDPKIRFDFNGLFSFDSLPVYDFDVNLYAADLHKLNIDKNPTSNISFNLNAKFEGNNINNSMGDIYISDLFFFRDSGYIATDSISFTSHFIEDHKEMVFYSEFIEGKISGAYNTLTLKNDFEAFVNYFMPSIQNKSRKLSGLNNFNFDIIANYPHPITELISPGFKISSGSQLTGSFNPDENALVLNANSDYVKYNKQTLFDLKIKAFTRNDELRINCDSRSFNYSEQKSLKNFLLSSRIKNDSIYLNNNWNNWLDKTYSGNLNNLISFSKHQNRLYYKIDFYPSNVNVLDTIWLVEKGFIKKDTSGILVDNLKISNGHSYFSANGIISNNANDSVQVNLERISTEHLNVLLNKERLKFQGQISGKAILRNVLQDPQLNSELNLLNFGLNGELLGETKLKTNWDKELEIININGSNIKDTDTTFLFSGFLSIKNQFIDIQTEINKQELSVLNPYLNTSFDNIAGNLSGKLRIYGDYLNPNWQGAAWGQGAQLRIMSTQVTYNFSDSVYFNNRDIVFNNITVFDKDKNRAQLNGIIHHEQFKIFSTDLEIRSNRILGLDTRSKDNPLFYGTVYGRGLVSIAGPTKETEISVVATTASKSYFYIPLEGKGDIKDNEFIEFVSFRQTFEQKEDKEAETIVSYRAPETVLKADITVTPEAEVQIIFDPRIGDALKANGNARLNMESVGKDFSMYGDYRINRGDFVFTLQNVINKRLEIQPGSTVSFAGHPLDAEINIDAVYKVRKASVFDLTQDAADENKRVEVDCHLLMTDKLVNPNINFAVTTPATTNNDAIDQLNSLPTEDLNKQVLSLLLVNKFVPYDPSLSAIPGASTGNLGATTASELLSNQLSNWLSQITSSFDVGFTYRPGDEITAQEYELALTTKLWDDRIILNGNVGYSDQQAAFDPISGLNTNPYTTDFQVEFKVNQKGNIRLRAFQKVNNDIEYNLENPYKQGVGIFYTEEFDNFTELMQKIFRKSTAKKPEEIELEEEIDRTPNS